MNLYEVYKLNRTIEKRSCVDLKSIRNILTLRYDPEKRVFGKKLRPQDFSEVKPKESVPERIESLLRNEIRKQIGAARDIAIPVGSGIDSAVIMTLAKRIFPDRNIFGISLGFSGSQDETTTAMAICKMLGVKCHVVRPDSVLRDLPLLIRIVGEPRWNLWYYYVLEHANKLQADILLTGDGGDELFGGYVFRYSKYLKSVMRRIELPFPITENDAVWAKRAWAYLQCHERDWVPDQHEMFGSKLANVFDWYPIIRYFKSYFNWASDDSDLSQLFLADYNGKLTYDWIPTNSKLAGYFGLKSSSPFLSGEVTNYATHLPIQHKYDKETLEGKLCLRKILEKYGMLNLVSKGKLGFGMDLNYLWDSYGGRIAEQYLEAGTILKENLIDRHWIKKTLHDPDRTKDPRYINKLLQLLSLEVWYQIFIAKSMSDEKKLD